MAHYKNYRFPVPEAKRMASLISIEQDLSGVVEYCDLMDKKLAIKDWNSIEWEAFSAAAVVRYARCFTSGVREPLNEQLLDAADDDLRQAHNYFIALRSKHVAHSVNPFEENDVTVQIATHYKSSTEIQSINSHHGRLLGLGFGEPALLKRLAQWLLKQVQQRMNDEKPKLLALAQAMALEQLKSFGRPMAAADTERHHVRRTRPRP